jgi:hypothetical protein
MTDAVIATIGMPEVAWSDRSRPSASTPLIPGQLDVHQDERGLPLVGQTHTLFARLGLDGLVAFDLEHVPDELPVLVVVFDDEDQLIGHDVPESRR